MEVPKTFEKDNSTPCADRKSEEVQDIIDRMPTHWATLTAWVVMVLMAAVVVLAFFIKYPDTVTGQMVITSVDAPVRLVANSRGRIALLRKDGALLHKGDIIAVIENGASLSDVLTVDSMCHLPIDTNTSFSIVNGLALGELSSSYNAFATAYRYYDQLRCSRLYDNMRKSLRQQMTADLELTDNMRRDMSLKDSVVRQTRSRHAKDSVLYVRSAISEEEYENRMASMLGQEQGAISVRGSILQKSSEIAKNKTQLARVELEEKDALRKALSEVLADYDKLCSDVCQWKDRYLLTSPINGKLEYLGFWRDNVAVQQGEELFAILPRDTERRVEAYVPARGMGKVRIGQRVNLKLNDYPYTEYGLVEGKVALVSQTMNKLSSDQGVIETYRLRISLPHGMVTNHGLCLALKREAKGTADIVTAPKRLIERLFDNLSSKQTK